MQSHAKQSKAMRSKTSESWATHHLTSWLCEASRLRHKQQNQCKTNAPALQVHFGQRKISLELSSDGAADVQPRNSTALEHRSQGKTLRLLGKLLEKRSQKSAREESAAESAAESAMKAENSLPWAALGPLILLRLKDMVDHSYSTIFDHAVSCSVCL